MIKTLPSNAGGVGSIPGWGAKILSVKKKQNIKQKQYCNKFNIFKWSLFFKKNLLKIKKKMPIKVQKPQKGLLSHGSISPRVSCDFEGARGQKSCLILIVSINFKDVITL